jgi:multidrug efflux pump subunit AcrB
VLLDVDLPVGASAERTQEVLRRAEVLLRQVPGVQHVLTLSENPFDLFGSGPCLLAQLTPAPARKSGREEVIGAIRTGLGEVKGMTVRVRDLSGPGRFPRCGYPIDLAVCGPEPELVREWARKLDERLRRDKKLTDVWVNPDSFPRPQRTVEVDREKAAALGVSLEDVTSTLRVFAGGVSVNDFARFGRTWRVEVQAEAGSGDLGQDIGRLKVRNVQGQMVPLSTIVEVREAEGPLALHFLDGRPMVEITANPGIGVSAAEARKLCEALADEVRKELRLPADYRLKWLQELPGTK